MNRTGISYFVVGLLVGGIAASGLFAWQTRNLRSGPADSTPSADGGASAGGALAPARVLKLAHGLDQGHPVHKAMEHMGRRLHELSGGTVELQIFPNGQLGGETESIEQLQNGALAMAKTSTAPMESFVPSLAVFGVPYAFRDGDHFWRVLEGPVGRELLDAGVAKGLRGLCYYDAGARSFYTIDRPVFTPADLKGLKIRVQKSQTAMNMVEALGGAPTPISWGELYTALQQGMVDGAENNLPSFFSNRHFEVCKHFSFDEHTMVPDMLIISERVWQGLPAQVQDWLREAAQDSSRFQRTLWAEETERARRAVLEEGVVIHEVDKDAFIGAVQGMHAAYAGTPVGDLLKRIQEAD